MPQRLLRLPAVKKDAMADALPANIDQEQLPPIARDHSMWGMTATQFFGAFNDNLFKQLVLLICLDQARRGGADYQPVALALFAIPFVMFSGLGGWLSDRNSKRQIVVLCKIAEIVVMALGLAAFLSGELNALFLVLFCMSTQSAFFGPAKYGILPEMFRDSDLPQANGIIQMTTFLAIIFGMVLAGFSKDWFEDRLWVISVMCVGIAVVGTLTSLVVRKTPVARADLPFTISALAINRQTWDLLRSDRELRGVLLVSSLFWLVGGAVQPTVNAFGKLQMEYGDTRTSILAACMGIGIALGCVIAGKASHKQVNFKLVTIGVWGIVGCLGLLTFLGVSGQSPEKLEWPARLALTLLGGFAGLFVVPLQVFLQTRPPQDQKGRMIGAMNLINWLGIMASAVFYWAGFTICETLKTTGTQPKVSWIFLALAVILLPVALFYRPKDSGLE